MHNDLLCILMHCTSTELVRFGILSWFEIKFLAMPCIMHCYCNLFWRTKVYFDALKCIMMQHSVFWCTVVPENEWDLVSDPAPGLSPAPTSFFCIHPLQRTWNAVLYMLVAPQPIWAYSVTRGAILCPPLNILGLGGVSWWGWSLVA